MVIQFTECPPCVKHNIRFYRIYKNKQDYWPSVSYIPSETDMHKEVESWAPGFTGNVPVSKSQAVSLVYTSVSPFKTQNKAPALLTCIPRRDAMGDAVLCPRDSAVIRQYSHPTGTYFLVAKVQTKTFKSTSHTAVLTRVKRCGLIANEMGLEDRQPHLECRERNVRKKI